MWDRYYTNKVKQSKPELKLIKRSATVPKPFNLSCNR